MLEDKHRGLGGEQGGVGGVRGCQATRRGGRCVKIKLEPNGMREGKNTLAHESNAGKN